MKNSLLWLPGIAVILTGCSLDPVFAPGSSHSSSYPEGAESQRQIYPSQSPSQEEADGPVGAEPVPSSPAVIALMKQAEANRRNGELDLAVSKLERALRIQPRNPGLWYQLALVRMQQQQPRLAEELAKKSISLAGNDRTLLRNNWRLISKAKSMEGDLSGAKEAARKAESY